MTKRSRKLASLAFLFASLVALTLFVWLGWEFVILLVRSVRSGNWASVGGLIVIVGFGTSVSALAYTTLGGLFLFRGLMADCADGIRLLGDGTEATIGGRRTMISGVQPKVLMVAKGLETANGTESAGLIFFALNRKVMTCAESAFESPAKARRFAWVPYVFLAWDAETISTTPRIE